MNKDTRLYRHQLNIASTLAAIFASVIISIGLVSHAHAVFQPGNNDAPASPTPSSQGILDRNGNKSSSTKLDEQSLVNTTTLIIGGGVLLLLAIVGIRHFKNKNSKVKSNS